MIHYPNMVPGTFRARPNRFIAHVEIGGREVVCHVKNTGRCRELLIPGMQVWCQHHDDPKRKTEYSLIAVQKGERLVNMDSQIPNKLAYDYVNQGGLGFLPDAIKAEKTFGSSRFDLYYEAGERKGFVEVKGVTLEEDGIVRFPDAPTERGAKHLKELQEAVKQGYEAWVLFVIQMADVLYFQPNEKTDPAFTATLREAAQKGVNIKAVECVVTPDSLEITKEVPVRLPLRGTVSEAD